jgi:hypothetical protein
MDAAMLDPAIKTAADAVLRNVPMELVKLYTRYALLLNALDVTRKGYENRTTVTLSTTANIPAPLRLPVEADVQLDRAGLVRAYGDELPVDFCVGFLVDLVSHFDAWMEDVYEQVLPILDPALSAKDIEKKVRSAWTDSAGMPALRRTFLVDLALQAPAGKISTPSMVFDRYEEMRELRHAVMHSGGVLTQKHVTKLQALAASVTAVAPAGASTVASGLVPGGLAVGAKVVVGAGQLLVLRRWAFDSLAYFLDSFQVS